MGRDTAGSGDPEEISVGGGLEFTDAGSIRRSALTGEVTAAAGSNAMLITDDAVINARLRNSIAWSVIGRSANSTGDPADIAAAAHGEMLRVRGTVLGFGGRVMRVISMSDATSFTPTADTADINTQTNTQAAGMLTANAPSGTPEDGQRLELWIKCTNVQTWSFNAIYRGGTALALPTTTSGGSLKDHLAFVYDSADAKWTLLAYTPGV
jgi:hypothetical protein